MRGATAPRLQLELICAKVLLPGADDSTNGIQARLDRMERRLAIGVPVRLGRGARGTAAVGDFSAHRVRKSPGRAARGAGGAEARRRAERRMRAPAGEAVRPRRPAGSPGEAVRPTSVIASSCRAGAGGGARQRAAGQWCLRQTVGVDAGSSTRRGARGASVTLVGCWVLVLAGGSWAGAGAGGGAAGGAGAGTAGSAADRETPGGWGCSRCCWCGTYWGLGG